MRILYLTYYFPPLSGPGSIRASKFVKYFREFGVKPVVLCADDTVYSRDETLIADLPKDLRIIRIPHTPIIKKLTKLKGTFLKRSADVETSQTFSGTSFLKGVKFRNNILKLLNSVYFPDDKIGWGQKAYRKSIQLCNEQNFKLIFSSSGPMTNHWIAHRLKKQINIPWVAEFRDLWVGETNYHAIWFRELIDLRAEKAWIENADAVVGVSDGICEYFKKLSEDSSRIEMIANGFDEDDFAAVEPDLNEKQIEKFEFLFVGTLYGNRSPETLLESIPVFFDRYPDFKDKVIFRFVGRIGGRFSRLFGYVEQQFPGVVVCEGMVPHQKAVKLMLEADALMFFIGGGDKGTGIPTAKIYEYIRAGKPILLLGPEGGEADQLLRKTGLGKAIDGKNRDLVAEALKAVMEGNWCADNIDKEMIDRFTRKAGAEKLTLLFKDVLSG